MELMGAKNFKEKSGRLIDLGRELLKLNPQWIGGKQRYDALSSSLNDLQAIVKDADGNLIIGLLGGTGVGKSSLISALAGETVSAAGIIRPSTNLPVIYLHQSYPGEVDLPGRCFIHNVKSLKNIVIVDFPDFDSFQQNNRQIVLNALPRLDMILWISDYNKYADRAFYDLMREVNSLVGSVAQRALLNKCDAFSDKNALNEVLQSFTQMLAEYGHWKGEAPIAVSALEALAAPDDVRAGGLGPLRELLLSLGDIKIRKCMEHANIEARVNGILEKLQIDEHGVKWQSDIEFLDKISRDCTPQTAIDIDLAALYNWGQQTIEAKVNLNKKQCRGLLKILSDLWDFALRRNEEPEECTGNPGAVMFSAYMSAQQAEVSQLISNQAATNEYFWLKKANEVIKSVLAAKTPLRSAPLSWPLWLWPVLWLFLSIWAEAGGSLSLSSVTAALLRSVAPWIIFSTVGDVFISRFIWFRLRRLYQRDFIQAQAQIRIALLALADEDFFMPLRKIAEQRQKALSLLQKINNLSSYHYDIREKL